MKVVIAGYGFVGKAVHAALIQHKNVQLFIDDPAQGHNYYRDEQIDPVDAVVVCVATPARKNGTCNTDNVEDVFNKYGDVKYLIKSAVDPVWLKYHANAFKGSYTYSPEFLRGSHSHGKPNEEFRNQTFAIYGGDDCRWWDELFQAVLPNCKDVRYLTLEQAAFAKYLENTFLATKVTFFNEMFKIYHEIGFEGFDAMVEAICLDKRIGKSHTQVPGPDGKFGFGGHCLPKDLAALRVLSKDTPLLDTVSNINDKIR